MVTAIKSEGRCRMSKAASVEDGKRSSPIQTGSDDSFLQKGDILYAIGLLMNMYREDDRRWPYYARNNLLKCKDLSSSLFCDGNNVRGGVRGDVTAGC